MKLLTKSVMATVVVLGCTLFNSHAHAAAGHESSGGGDSCERRIREISADILSWINLGKFESLQFPDGVSSEQYKNSMVSLLKPDKVIISCPDSFNEKDYKKIIFEDVQKTCVRYVSSLDQSAHIDCDFNRFNSLNSTLEGQAEQYRLVHHEYAGLAELEKNSGPSSHYEISNQITANLKQSVVLRLVIGSEAEEKTRSSLDTIVTKCSFSASAGFSWKYPKPNHDVAIAQANPSKSPWRHSDGMGLNILESFKVIPSSEHQNSLFLPTRGTISGVWTVDQDQNLKITLRSTEDGLYGVLLTQRQNLSTLMHAKKFTAKITMISYAGDLADADMECTNILN